MKKILFSLLMIAGFAFSSSAQVTKPVQTAKISIPTVQCEMCKTKIETYLKRYDGINTVNVNWRRKEVTVKYLVDRISEEEIKTAIANVGYDANEVAANPESYKKLPICCKKPEDGGGKAKKN
jgi:periplasmic mercuric ion binding protein